ncbi:thiolase family protein [Gottfriedia acidiceleris]|uniref:thiolase family protein n=1 Tax=Bacillaceae TaxID=186817 RepID=UPI000BED76CC|nr:MULTISPECIES: thiolase family protein [unclassified Bacillus (in: firmicutes)]PEC48783.1 acetyl-CoA C-acyltransferase [Bacillus sp. AFS096315]PFM82803.1 acetyl-CoA C-acyltransferase [Bacillus sp. AFS077874]
MREVVIVDALRTPIGKRGGSFSETRPDDLAAIVLKELVSRYEFDPKEIDDVIMGCVTQIGEQAGDIGRVAALLAGLPIEVPGVTIDRQCGSSQQSVHFASQAILSGDMDIVIAAGVESMTRVPMFSNLKGSKWNEKLTNMFGDFNQGISAERINEKWNISRSEQDEFAYNSHQKALKAMKQGYFEDEIVAVSVTNQEGELVNVTKDEGPRENSSIEKLSTLRPAFTENGSVTAGNASQISDGAAGLLLMSKEKAHQLGFKPKFRIIGRTVVGSDPQLMLTGPIQATQKVLHKCGLTIDQIDLFEINEAFAAVPLAWQKELNVPFEKLNIFGGAIALGHPLGASGARVMVTLCNALEKTGGRFGLQAICEGHGMANATIIERLN